MFIVLVKTVLALFNEVWNLELCRWPVSVVC